MVLLYLNHFGAYLWSFLTWRLKEGKTDSPLDPHGLLFFPQLSSRMVAMGGGGAAPVELLLDRLLFDTIWTTFASSRNSMELTFIFQYLRVIYSLYRNAKCFAGNNETNSIDSDICFTMLGETIRQSHVLGNRICFLIIKFKMRNH